jgi:hypothetical protein
MNTMTIENDAADIQAEEDELGQLLNRVMGEPLEPLVSGIRKLEQHYGELNKEVAAALETGNDNVNGAMQDFQRIIDEEVIPKFDTVKSISDALACELRTVASGLSDIGGTITCIDATQHAVDEMLHGLSERIEQRGQSLQDSLSRTEQQLAKARADVENAASTSRDAVLKIGAMQADLGQRIDTCLQARVALTNALEKQDRSRAEQMRSVDEGMKDSIRRIENALLAQEKQRRDETRALVEQLSSEFAHRCDVLDRRLADVEKRSAFLQRFSIGAGVILSVGLASIVALLLLR